MFFLGLGGQVGQDGDGIEVRQDGVSPIVGVQSLPVVLQNLGPGSGVPIAVAQVGHVVAGIKYFYCFWFLYFIFWISIILFVY